MRYRPLLSLTFVLTVGCSSGGDEATPAHDAVSPLDSNISDSEGGPDASHETDAIDTGSMRDADAFDTHSDPDTRITDAPWIGDGPWDSPSSDSHVADGGCLKLWSDTVTAAPPPHAFGAGGLTLVSPDTLQQGFLEGDFDVTLEVDQYSADDPLSPIELYVEGTIKGPTGRVASASVALHTRVINRNVDSPSGFSSFRAVPATATGATLQIRRTGADLRVTATATDGASLTDTFVTITNEPMRLMVRLTGGRASVRLKRLTVVGGGDGVHSDDFACDSIFGE